MRPVIAVADERGGVSELLEPGNPHTELWNQAKRQSGGVINTRPRRNRIQGNMAKKIAPRTYDAAVTWLRDHGFDILEAPGTANRIFIKKYNCSAAIEKSAEGAAKVFAYPGYLIGGEISKLVDRGYQKFLRTTKTEIAATADHLRALHQFSEELKEALGATSLYNESLGSVSESYVYDRVRDREKPEAERPVRPWQSGEPKRRA